MMEAPACSLSHMQLCAKGLRDAIVGWFLKGIKVAKIALENTQEDFKTTVTRTGEAARWKHGVADSWFEKGKEVCGTLLEEAVEAFREAEEREGAKTRIRLTESHEELQDLADKVEKQAASETEPEPFFELGESQVQKRQCGESGPDVEEEHAQRVKGTPAEGAAGLCQDGQGQGRAAQAG
jgi:hypothetical protein